MADPFSTVWRGSHIAILCRAPGSQIDAIRAASFSLLDGLRLHDVGGEIVDWPLSPAGREALAATDAVVIQYNPFSYGRRGFAPRLPVELGRLRRHSRRPVLALVIHEPYVPMKNVRWALMGTWQRAQLAATRLQADVVFASIEAWRAKFARWRPHRPTFHLPSGSNLPDRREARTEARRELEAGDGLVVATLSGGHPSHDRRLLREALAAIAAVHDRPTYLALGSQPLAFEAPSDLRAVTPGMLPPADLARLLAAADVFLAPLIDGVSTRRTTVAAALQHGLAVLGTDGPLTDQSLRTSGAIELTPVGARDAFAAEAAALAQDPRRRAALGAAARALFERELAWPVIAGRLLDRLPPRVGG